MKHAITLLKITKFSAACILTAVLMASAIGCGVSKTPEVKGGGGIFRVMLATEPTSLNPDLRTDDSAFNICQNLLNKLVTLDADYRIIPDLAEKWKVSDDGLTYTFYLAKNVRWHDGQPLTSADVKWTYETIASVKGVAQDAASRVTSIDLPNDLTVVMHLKESWAPFLPTIAWYGTFILPKHIYASTDWTTNSANIQPVGTGPFKFSEWVKGDHITLTANLEYFRRGPYLDSVVYYVPKDPSALKQLLVNNEIDYSILRPSYEQIPGFKGTSGINVRTFSHPARYYIGFNLRRQPFDDLRIRQAINMAINRTALVDGALLGYGAPGLGFYTPAVPWAYNTKVQVPGFDLAGAQGLLDQAGLKPNQDGVRLKLSIITSSGSPFKELAQVLKGQLAAVGIEVNVVLVSAAEYTTRVTNNKDFDLALTNGSWGPDPDNLNTRFGSQGANQFMGYASADFDAAIAEGGSKPKIEDRAKAYFRAQEILARDLPLAPLAEYVQIIIARSNVTGLPQVEARGLVTFQDYSLVQLK
jgi:peptide/nickel transport system substrate-binding protein